jgi:hypothetical protein
MSYDPYGDKAAAYGDPRPISAQPVQSTAGYSGTVSAAPYVAPAAVAHNAQPYAQPYGNNQHDIVARPAPGRWRDSICDWPSNIFPSCYCACCCCYGMYLVAQSNNSQFVLFIS